MDELKTTADKVRAVMAEVFGVPTADLKPEVEMVPDLGIDSLDTVELLIALEEEFAITIADDDWEKVRTVQDAVDVVERLKGQV
jgi:acyl carrier protein